MEEIRLKIDQGMVEVQNLENDQNKSPKNGQMRYLMSLPKLEVADQEDDEKFIHSALQKSQREVVTQVNSQDIISYPQLQNISINRSQKSPTASVRSVSQQEKNLENNYVQFAETGLSSQRTLKNSNGIQVGPNFSLLTYQNKQFSQRKLQLPPRPPTAQGINQGEFPLSLNNSFGNDIIQQRMGRNENLLQKFSTKENETLEEAEVGSDDDEFKEGGADSFYQSCQPCTDKQSSFQVEGGSSNLNSSQNQSEGENVDLDEADEMNSDHTLSQIRLKQKEQEFPEDHYPQNIRSGGISSKHSQLSHKKSGRLTEQGQREDQNYYQIDNFDKFQNPISESIMASGSITDKIEFAKMTAELLRQTSFANNQVMSFDDVHDQMNRTGKFNTNTVNNLQPLQKDSLMFDNNYVPQFTDEDQIFSGEKQYKKRRLFKNETAKIIDSPQSFLKIDYPDDISINQKLMNDQVPNTIFQQNHLSVPNSQIPLGPQQYQSMNSYNFSSQVPQYYDYIYSNNQSKVTSSKVSQQYSRPEIQSEKTPYQKDEVKKQISQFYNLHQNKSNQEDYRQKLITEKKASTIQLQEIQQILKDCITFFTENLDKKVFQISDSLKELQKDNIQTEKYLQDFTKQVNGIVSSFQQDINSLYKWRNAYQVKENKWAEEIMDLQDKCQQRQFQIDHLKQEFAEQLLSLQKFPVKRRQSLILENPIENNLNEQHFELKNMIQNFFEIVNEQKTLKSLQKQKNRGSSQEHIHQPNLNEIINDNLLGGQRRRSESSQMTPQSVLFGQQNLNSKYEEIFTEIGTLFSETFSENYNLQNSIEAVVAISIRSYFELGYFLEQEIVDDADLQGQYIKEIKQQIKQKVYDKLQELKKIQLGMSIMAIDIDYGKEQGKPPFKKKRQYQNLQISSEVSSQLQKSNSLNLEPINIKLHTEVNSHFDQDHRYQMKNYGTNTFNKTDEFSHLSLQDKFNIGEKYIGRFSEIIDDARNNLVTQLSQLQKQLSLSRQLLLKLHSQTENDKKQQINLQDQVLKLTTQLTSEASEHIQTKKRCDKLQRTFDNHQQQTDGLMNQIEKSEELILQKDRQINKIQEELKWQQIEVSKHQQLIFDFQTEIHRKKMLIENLQKEVLEKQTQADEYEQNIKIQDMEIKQLHDQIDNNFTEVVLRDVTLWLEETLTYNTHFLIQQEIVNQLVLHFEDQSPDRSAQGILSKLVKHSNEFEPVRQRLKGNVKGIKIKIKEYKDMISQQNIQYKQKKQISHSFIPESPSQFIKESSIKSRRQTGSRSQGPVQSTIIDVQIFQDKDDQFSALPFPLSPKGHPLLESSSRSQKSIKQAKNRAGDNFDNLQQQNQDLSLRLELVLDEKQNLQKRLKSLQTRLLKLEDLRQKEEINQTNLKALKQRFILVIDKLKQIILDSKETKFNVSMIEDLLKKLDQLPSVGSLTFNYQVSQATLNQPNYDYLHLSKLKSEQYFNNANYENNDSEEDTFRSFQQFKNSSNQKPRQKSMHLNTSQKKIQNPLNKDFTISEINQEDSQISLRLEYEIKSSERQTGQQIQIIDHKEDKNLQQLNQSSILDESQSMISVKNFPNELQQLHSQIGDKKQSDFGARHVSFGQNINVSTPSKLMDEIFRSRTLSSKETQTELIQTINSITQTQQTEQIINENINLEDIYIFTSNQRDLHIKVNQIIERQWVQVHIQEDGLQLATESSLSMDHQQKDQQIDIYIQNHQDNDFIQQNNSQPHPSPASDNDNQFQEVNDNKKSFKFYDNYVPDEQRQKVIQHDDLTKRQSNLYDLDIVKLNQELMARTPIDEVHEAGLNQTQALRGQSIGDMLIIEDSREYEEENQQYANFRPSGSEGFPEINEHFFQPENERQYGVKQVYQNEQLDVGLDDDEDEALNNKYVYNYFNSAVPETIQEEQDGEGESQNLNEDLNYSKNKGNQQTNSSENLQKSQQSIQEINSHFRQLSLAIQPADITNESSSKQSFHSVAGSQINSQNQDTYSESQRSQQSRTKSSKSKYLTKNLNQ